MRNLFIALVALTLTVSASAQSAEKMAVKKSLAGYNYMEIVEKAAPTKQGLPLVIALHWSSSTPDEFATYITGFTKGVRVLFLEGPYVHPRSGFSFFVRSPKSYYDMSDDEKMEQLLAEAAKLNGFIRAAEKLYAPKFKPMVVGASQGGDLSYVTAIRYGDTINAAFPMLATVDERIIRDKQGKNKSAPIFAFHGGRDTIVSIETAEGHINLLKKAGFKAELFRYDGTEHDISELMKSDVVREIEKAFAKTPR